MVKRLGEQSVGEVAGLVVQELRPVQQAVTSVPDPAEDERRIAAAREKQLGLVGVWLGTVGVGSRLCELQIDPELVPAECAQWTELYERGAGMILAGPVGSGKTVAAVHCLREVYERGERHNPETRQWSWNPASSLFVKARTLYRAVFDRDHALLDRARGCRVLVIDEWGGAYESAWPLAEMDGLIDDRWEERRATIITTNMNPESDSGLKATAPRAFDRLRDEPGPGVVVVNRESLRGES